MKDGAAGHLPNATKHMALFYKDSEASNNYT